MRLIGRSFSILFVGALVVPATTLAQPQDEAAPDAQATDEAADSGSWLDDFGFRMFVDGYYQKDWLFPENSQDIQGDVGHRAFAHTNGFALSFVGLDVDYQTEQFGATLDLRFGPSTPRLLIGQPEEEIKALENLKQAFVSWRPIEGLQLDLGQFDTIYGAEVSESFENVNYTRGALYYLMQPFFHTGLRAAYQVNDTVSLTGLVVNGTNIHVDFNEAPDVGIQLGLTPTDDIALAAGYLFSVTSPDNQDYAHFFDLVGTAAFGDWSLVFNADAGIDQTDGAANSVFWGVSLAGNYGVTDWFDVGLRGEVLGDPDDFFYGPIEDVTLLTGTLTLGFKPIPGRDNLLIRLDNRIEWATEALFPGQGASSRQLEIDGETLGRAPAPADFHDLWGSTTLGVVVKTN